MITPISFLSNFLLLAIPTSASSFVDFSPRLCDNGGLFLGTFCLADYNCNGQKSGQKQGQQPKECIRGRCCARTKIPKWRVNVRREYRDRDCARGSFSVGIRCRHTQECLRRADKAARSLAFPLLECAGGGSCCTSSRYRKPLGRGEQCLNGGRAEGRGCERAEECADGGRRRRGKRRRREAECVDGECCGRTNIREEEDGRDEDESEEEEDGEEEELRADDDDEEEDGEEEESRADDDDEEEDGEEEESRADDDDEEEEEEFDSRDGLAEGRRECGRHGLDYRKVRRCLLNKECGTNLECIMGFCCEIRAENGWKQDEDERREEDGRKGPGMNDEEAGGGHAALSPIRPASANALCYDGTWARGQCFANSDCVAPQQICVNGLCCAVSGDANQYACGGLQGTSRCSASRSGSGSCSASPYGLLHCVSPGVCCECRHGQPQPGIRNCHSVARIMCAFGYRCDHQSGFCCPQCPNGQIPFGSCRLGRCGSGFACRPGNICCPIGQ